MFLYVLRFMRAKIVQKNGLAKRMITYFRLHPRNVLIFKQFKRRTLAESRLLEQA
jgi:hypothetical protein